MSRAICRQDEGKLMRRKYFGTTSEGIPVHIFDLESASGVAVQVMEYGASVVSIETPDRDGRTGPIVLGFDELAGYLEPNPLEPNPLDPNPPLGATLGRYAGRIGGAAFRLSGTLHRVSRGAGPRQPHGGAAGLHRAVWWGEALSEGVRFHYCSPAGEEGYPGALDCSVEYRLDPAGDLRVDYRATTNALTVVDLASQIYFNLSDGGRTAIFDHELMIAADEVVEVDREGIPTGHFLSVDGSALDFTSARRVGGRIGNLDLSPDGYDHCYVLRQSTETLRAVAWICDPESGRSLEVSTSQPGIRFENGSALRPRRGRQPYGLCLCPQNLTDAPNHRHFPSPRLAPGSSYEQTNVFRFRSEH